MSQREETQWGYFCSSSVKSNPVLWKQIFPGVHGGVWLIVGGKTSSTIHPAADSGPALDIRQLRMWRGESDSSVTGDP